MAAVGLTRDRALARAQLELGQLRQRHPRATGSRHRKVGNRLGRAAHGLDKAHRDVVATLALKHLRDGFAADGHFQKLRDILHVDAKARGQGAIDFDLQLRQWRLLIDGDVGTAGHRAQQVDHVACQSARFG